MADSDNSLLALLTTAYPNVPKFTILKVISKYGNDEEKCRQALDSEIGRSSGNAESELFAAGASLNSSNNLESPSEAKSIATRIKELQMSQAKSPSAERHVSTIERPVGNTSRPPEPPRRPQMGQSVSLTIQASDRGPSPLLGAQAPSPWTPANPKITPQTAPPDFTPFFNQSAREIPNIHCKTSGGVGQAAYGAKLHQISNNSSPASNSPVEQRRPVKVINIPAGSLSGGSVSPAATPPNSRHIRMHFGDTGGICTISSPPSTVQHYGPTPSSGGTFRSEIRTEAPTSQPVHSSSIVVNTSSHSNHLAPDRKLNASNSNDTSGHMRTPNPPTSFNTNDSGSGLGSVFPPGKLSTPIQASSPGITHSKPVFVEIKTGSFSDTSYPPSFYQGAGVRPPPAHLSYMSHQSGPFGAQGSPMNYGNQYNPDFSNATGFSLGHQHQEPMYLQNPQQKKHPNFSGPLNVYPQPPGASYSPTSYPHFNPPVNIMGYPLIGIAGTVSGQTPGHLSLFNQYGPHMGHQPVIHVPKSPSVGQVSLGSRSNSQESEHSLAADFDPRHPPYNTMGSRVSSHSSLSSDSSSSHLDRVDPSVRPRSGSIQDDAEYIRALVQHQRSQVQKLLEEVSMHKGILHNLRSDVGNMEKNMLEASHVSSSFPSIQDISGLCESNRRLQTDIQLMMNEIDMYKSGQTPFNKINPLDQQNFFANMPTGQQESIYSRSPDGITSSPRIIPPPRPPPPIPPPRQRSTDPTSGAVGGVVSGSDIFRVPPVPPPQPMVNSGDSEEGESWNCSACTFSNHPALKKCEMCEMPRVMPPHPASSLGPPMSNPSALSLSALPPRLAPGLVGGIRHRSASPHSPLGHHHHHAGT